MQRIETELVHMSGVKFKVFLTEYEVTKAESDIDFANELVQKYYTLFEKDLVSPLSDTETLENVIVQRQEHGDNVETEIISESESTFRWTDEQTKFLINQYKLLFGKSNKPKDPKRTNKALYIEISKSFLKNNITISWQQIETKIKGLMKTYKNIKDNDNSSGRGTIRWQYFDLIDEFMGHRPEVVPLSVSSNLQAEQLSQAETDDSSCSINHKASPSTIVDKRQKVKKRRVARSEEDPQWFKQFRLDSERRHTERMEAINKLNNTLEMLVSGQVKKLN